MDENFNIFLNALRVATSRINDVYFNLPIADDVPAYRERVYCYELYHQLRIELPENYTYILSGEVDKGGHPIIYDQCNRVIPDLLVHRPGNMGDEDNLVVVEVKHINSAHLNHPNRGLLKDIRTINCLTDIENGYYRGLFLIFGNVETTLWNEIVDHFQTNLQDRPFVLMFHNTVNVEGQLVFEDKTH